MQHNLWQIFSALLACLLSGCVSLRTGSCPKNSPAVTPDVAVNIAVQAVNIKDRARYKLQVSKGDEKYVAFYVYYEAKDEGIIPSFGTVAIDFCGKVLTVSRPL